jgi:carbon monoxide dehydrogenase subunit G
VQFENRATVPARCAAVWDFLMDIKRVGACVPGVDELREVDADQYQAIMRLKVGPIALTLDGTMRVVERDPERRKATMRAEGRDKAVGGEVTANVVITLVERGPDSTELVIHTDANVLGKLGEFGQPVMRRKADTIMKELAGNISRCVAARS